MSQITFGIISQVNYSKRQIFCIPRKHKGQPIWFHCQNCGQTKNITTITQHITHTHTHTKVLFSNIADVFRFVCLKIRYINLCGTLYTWFPTWDYGFISFVPFELWSPYVVVYICRYELSTCRSLLLWLLSFNFKFILIK